MSASCITVPCGSWGSRAPQRELCKDSLLPLARPIQITVLRSRLPYEPITVCLVADTGVEPVMFLRSGFTVRRYSTDSILSTVVD